MTTDSKKRFTVITNNDFYSDTISGKVTNPISNQTQDLREKLMKFRKKEQFNVDDLLKW